MSLAGIVQGKLRQVVILGALSALVCSTGCKQSSDQTPDEQVAAEQAALDEQNRLDAEQEAKRREAEEAARLAAAEAKKITIVKEAGFMTPESVLYVEPEDIYLVSNINGAPTEQDNNGFISRVAPDGKIAELKWITGGEKGVTLNAPKGMAIREDVLYVADINTVRMFDLKSGEAKGEIKIKGAAFLNDLTAAPDGTLYVSDSGLKSGAQGLEPTETDAIYQIAKNNKAEKLIAGKELNRPNGLLADENGLFVVTFGSAELYRVTKEGQKEAPVQLPAGSLDGLAMANDGDLLISSWDSETIYKGKPGGEFAPIITELKSPAGLAYDRKRNQIIVPVFMEDALRMQSLGPVNALALRPEAPEPEVAAEKAEETPEEAKSGKTESPAASDEAKAAKAEKGAPEEMKAAETVKTGDAKPAAPPKPAGAPGAGEKAAPPGQ